MKKILSFLLIFAILAFSSGSYALDINMAYNEFKTLHPEFVKTLTDSGISEATLLSFIYELYNHIMEIDQSTPVTVENFESLAVSAMMNVTSRANYTAIQDALLIHYPDAIRLAVVEGKISDEVRPLVDTVKKILFDNNTFEDNSSGNSTGNSSVSSQESINTFKDMPTSHWAYTPVWQLASRFILNGYLDGSFRPENNITRAEFAKIIVSATDTFDHTMASSFKDVSESDWYYSYVSTAYKLGYIKGYPDGTFHPGDNITRADICTIVNRVLRASSSGNVPVFNDDGAIPDYARDSVYALVDKGIINGYGNGIFAPTAYATRAQTAKIIYEAFFRN